MAVALTTGFTQTQSSPGLHVTVNAGDAVVSGAVVRFPKGDVALAANTTTYVYLNFNSGAIETSTSGFLNGAWPICTAQTNTTDCVRVTDLRPDAFGGGGTAINFADAETPTGVLNGSNTTYTLAHTPNPATSLKLYYAPDNTTSLLLLSLTLDYTLATATITTTFAPNASGRILAFYRY